MPPTRHLALLAATCLGLAFAPAPAPTTGGGNVPAATLALSIDADDPAVLQSLLKATDEEWSVIYPQLERIRSLREEIHTITDMAMPDRQSMFGGVFDSPMGGTSLDTPVMPDRFGGGRAGARGAPFDPAHAPGRVESNSSSLMGTLRGLAGHAMINLVLADQQHPVLAALKQLQTLLDTRNATDEQLRDALAAVRTVRKKVARDLDAAQNDLLPYLTLQQTALLVSLGILE